MGQWEGGSRSPWKEIIERDIVGKWPKVALLEAHRDGALPLRTQRFREGNASGPMAIKSSWLLKVTPSRRLKSYHFRLASLGQINDRDCAAEEKLYAPRGEDVHTSGRPESFFRWMPSKEAGAIISQVG